MNNIFSLFLSWESMCYEDTTFFLLHWCKIKREFFNGIEKASKIQQEKINKRYGGAWDGMTFILM